MIEYMGHRCIRVQRESSGQLIGAVVKEPPLPRCRRTWSSTTWRRKTEREGERKKKTSPNTERKIYVTCVRLVLTLQIPSSRESPPLARSMSLHILGMHQTGIDKRFSSIAKTRKKNIVSNRCSASP